MEQGTASGIMSGDKQSSLFGKECLHKFVVWRRVLPTEVRGIVQSMQD